MAKAEFKVVGTSPSAWAASIASSAKAFTAST